MFLEITYIYNKSFSLMKKEERIMQLKKDADKIIDKAISENRDMTVEEENEVSKLEQAIKELREQSEVVEEEPKQEEEQEKETPQSEEEETPAEEEPKEEEEEEDNKRSNISINTMKEERNFSLVKAIRAIANNQQLDELTAEVIKQGQEEARKAGISTQGQIQIPTKRAVDVVTVGSEGEDLVMTNILDILTPLRAKNVLAQAGAKIMGNLVGDVQVPIMSGNNVAWEGEIADAPYGDPSFSSVKLTPHRLTAYVDISKQMLVQDSLDVENVIRTDLINAINSKLEETILGDGDGKEGGAVVIAPEGMFHALQTTIVEDYAGICDLESDIEDANVLGECKYVMSNKAKSALRSMIKGTNATGMVYENNSVDGTPAYNTSHVEGTNLIYGDWSNLAIGHWGGIDLTVDPYTKAAAGQVRIVVNAFFDAKILRPEAFAAGQVGDDSSDGGL